MACWTDLVRLPAFITSSFIFTVVLRCDEIHARSPGGSTRRHYAPSARVTDVTVRGTRYRRSIGQGPAPPSRNRTAQVQ